VLNVRVSTFCYTVPADQADEQDVEAASDGVEDGANSGIKDGVGRSQAVCDQEQFTSIIRIRLDQQGIWALQSIRSDLLLDRFEIGFGPVDCGLGV
jgi:hypothetical protein